MQEYKTVKGKLDGTIKQGLVRWQVMPSIEAWAKNIRSFKNFGCLKL